MLITGRQQGVARQTYTVTFSTIETCAAVAAVVEK